ncbi:MAG: antibiotic biosynthesis monooxygenase [Dongiaceae bacterium]
MAIVTISALEVSQDRIDQTIEVWRRYNNFLMKQPGYVSSKLHRATEAGSSFALVNVAEWKSEQEYHNAVEQMIAQLGPPTVPGLRIHPAVYETVS